MNKLNLLATLLLLSSCTNKLDSSIDVPQSESKSLESISSLESSSSNEESSVIESSKEESEESQSSESEIIEDPKEKLKATNYDFGNEENWKKDKITVTDLGDCILDAFPYDNHYDWGQSIIYDEDEHIYKMWWCRQSGFDTIWYAESNDLKHWHNAQKILLVENDSTWIKLHIGKPAVLKINNKYMMYFEAPATLPDVAHEFDNNVLLATSDDGIHFEYYTGDTDEACPVIRMSDEQLTLSYKQYEEGTSGYGFYGIGQPSVCYVDNTFYVYVTYSVGNGDLMYLFKSNDGIHFERGTQVFTRAGCGVKYNDLTNKFMLLYEQTVDGQSKIGYMESNDGINFTYKDLTMSYNNPNIVSRGNGLVRGYADFVANGQGHINDYTFYCAFMEGKTADAGHDWRQYSNTWDIHITMVNLPQYGNRTQVLPNGYVVDELTLPNYDTKHVEYDDIFEGIKRYEIAPSLDGKLNDVYLSGKVFDIARQNFINRCIPTNNTAKAYMGYDDNYLYIYIDVKDNTINDDDLIYVLFDERRFAKSNGEIVHIKAYRDHYEALDSDKNPRLDIDVKPVEKEDGFAVEIRIPWVIKNSIEKYDSFGFDCYIFNESNNLNYKSCISFNDIYQTYNIERCGEIYFL